MHIHKTKKLIKAALYASVIACAAGAATGTYAWYSYQKDVDANMTGTTIKADKEIQVGLRSATEISGLESAHTGIIEKTSHKYSENDGTSFYVYWIKGNYLSEVLKTFQSKIHSADGLLNAITAGSYTSGMDEDVGAATPTDGKWHGFKKSPSYSRNERTWNGDVVKNYNDYFYLPLAFRAVSNEKDEGGNYKYLKDVEIYLSAFDTVDIDADADGDLAPAVRCKVDYPANGTDTSKNFIFNPTADNDANLEVGGILNLDHNDTYDYYNDPLHASRDYEIPYGEWAVGPVWKTTATGTTASPKTLDECTTFDANHKKDTYAIDFEQSQPAVCQTKKASAGINSTLQEAGIIKTSSYGNIGYVDLSIYLEGWDHSIINTTTGHTFAVDLTFSIN